MCAVFFITFTAFEKFQVVDFYYFSLLCTYFNHVTHKCYRLTPTHIHSHAVHSKMLCSVYHYAGKPLFKFRNNESISWFANITFMPMLLLISKCIMDEHTDTYTHTRMGANWWTEKESEKKTYSVLIETEIKKKRRTSSCTCEFCTYALKAYAFVYCSHRCECVSFPRRACVCVCWCASFHIESSSTHTCLRRAESLACEQIHGKKREASLSTDSQQGERESSTFDGFANRAMF